MSLDEATWESVNVIFAQLDLDVGPENVTETAHEMGIEAPLESVPAEAIGGLRYGVTPLEMADAYATLASGGVHHDPTAISRVEFPGGDVDEADADSGDRVLTEGQAYEVTRILEGVITAGTGAGYTYMGCTSEAGKTGTSEDLSDAWFAGYTPIYSTAVWVGPPAVARSDRLRRSHRRPDLGLVHVGGGERQLPRIRSPRQPARALRPEQRTHPLLLGSRARDRTVRRRRRKKKKKDEEEEEKEEKEEGGDNGGGNAPAPTPTPTPAPTPAPRRPRRPRRRRAKASAAASPRRPASRLQGIADRSGVAGPVGIAGLDCRRCRFGTSQRSSSRSPPLSSPPARSPPPLPWSTATSRPRKPAPTRRSSRGPTATCG